jgi:hypothetical protein
MGARVWTIRTGLPELTRAMPYRRPWRARCPPGRHLVRGGRCDRYDQFNRERVVRDRHFAAFEVCGASDST